MTVENVAAMILGEPNEGNAEAGSPGEEYEAVAADIIAGAADKKPEVLAKGLKAFIELCLASHDSEGDYLEED